VSFADFFYSKKNFTYFTKEKLNKKRIKNKKGKKIAKTTKRNSTDNRESNRSNIFLKYTYIYICFHLLICFQLNCRLVSKLNLHLLFFGLNNLLINNLFLNILNN
jgi:hypothetical protein